MHPKNYRIIELTMSGWVQQAGVSGQYPSQQVSKVGCMDVGCTIMTDLAYESRTNAFT